MAPPVLYMMHLSQPVRAVLMTARELGIELELKECNLFEDEHLSEDYLKLNPAHTVPTLDDDGFVVWESAAIMSYLVSKYGETDHLYPRDVKQRATVDKLLHFSTSSFTKYIYIGRHLFVHKKKKDTIPKENMDMMVESVEVLDKIIGNKKFVAGDNLTIADFSFVAWISAIHLIFPLSKERYPNIHTWCKRMQELPSYEANRKGLEEFSGLWAEYE